MDSTLALGAFRIARGAGGEAVDVNGNLVEREEGDVWNRNSCVLIDYRLWAAKSEGRPWVEHCIEQCIEHPPEPRSGLCPELLADFRIPKPPGCSQGAQRAVSCAVRVADFLAEGAGWGASPGRGGELGCQAKKVIAAVEFELKLLDQVEVSAVWIPHWHSEPFESQGTRAAKRWT